MEAGERAVSGSAGRNIGYGRALKWINDLIYWQYLDNKHTTLTCHLRQVMHPHHRAINSNNTFYTQQGSKQGWRIPDVRLHGPGKEQHTPSPTASTSSNEWTLRTIPLHCPGTPALSINHSPGCRFTWFWRSYLSGSVLLWRWLIRWFTEKIRRLRTRKDPGAGHATDNHMAYTGSDCVRNIKLKEEN